MTKDEAITTILERMGDNEQASMDLVNALLEAPEVIAVNPKVAIAFIQLMAVRMETARIVEEAREVLGGPEA